MRLIYLTLFLIATVLGCRTSTEIDTAQSPVITGLQIAPETVCGSADVTFTVTDPNRDMIQWEARMNVTAYGNVEQTSGNVSSGTVVVTKFNAVTNMNHRHRVTLTVTARDNSGNESPPARLEFLVFYPC
jgi:hypothetical protein